MSSLPELRPDAISLAIDVLRDHQAESGAFPGDYSGPLFLLPLYVGTCYATGQPPEPELREEMVRWLREVQNPDGGFGLGEQNPSCVFTSVLNYVAMRMLDVPASDPDATRARVWFRAHGGPLGAASWGRFFLTVMNLYAWEGLHPIPPEAWLLPYGVPLHPGRMWCHARMVYLPMSWMYGRRAQIPLDPLLVELRTELYNEPYDQIDWVAARRHVDPLDAYTPHTRPLKLTHALLGAYERVASWRLRERALDEVLHQIRYEDEITSHICIGPVNKLYNTLVWHFAAPGGAEVARHLERLPLYLHRDERGARMNGYNNSQLWDTAFAMQALMETGRPGEVEDVVQRAHGFLDASQIPEDPPEAARHYRGHAEGGWPFSNLEHGWPITDCTAEGLEAALASASLVRKPIATERLDKAVSAILRWQNTDGGWASYELRRAGAWLEWFNPSDIFGGIMVDHSYVECTSACLRALAAWQRHHGGQLPEVEGAIARGLEFLLAQQRPDGSFLGSWGVCYTYGTWFGIEGMSAAGLPPDHRCVQRAVGFLEKLQQADGGWSEHVVSCAEGRSIPAEGSQAVMTSWALLALMTAGRAEGESVRRGIAWLHEAQHADGTWQDSAIAGVFNRTCSIRYDNYVRVFPLWALGRYERALRPTGADRS